MGSRGRGGLSVRMNDQLTADLSQAQKRTEAQYERQKIGQDGGQGRKTRRKKGQRRKGKDDMRWNTSRRHKSEGGDLWSRTESISGDGCKERWLLRYMMKT